MIINMTFRSVANEVLTRRGQNMRRIRQDRDHSRVRMMDDELKQRDLSSKPDSQLTADERKELKRRFDEFVGIMRSQGMVPSEPASKPKKVEKWNPMTHGRRN